MVEWLSLSHEYRPQWIAEVFRHLGEGDRRRVTLTRLIGDAHRTYFVANRTEVHEHYNLNESL